MRFSLLSAALLALSTILPATPASAAFPARETLTLPDGRTMSYRCAGKGGPVTILESGWSADSRLWSRILPPLARNGQVCAFDRAGEGLSDAGPRPRDPEAIARDLNDATRVLGLPPPYVLVGHSAGGLYVTRFAQRHPGRTAALLLIDPSIRRTPAPPGLMQRAGLCLAIARGQPLPEDTPTPKCGKADDHSVARWSMRLSEIQSLALPSPAVPDVPRRILTATAGRTPEQLQTLMTLQGELLRVPPEPVASGHMMMFEKPDAIRAAAEALRRAAR